MAGTKNPFLKIRPASDPYVILSDNGWTWRVLKLWQSPAKSIENPFSRAFCSVTSPSCPEGELGDVYVESIPGLIEWLRKSVA